MTDEEMEEFAEIEALHEYRLEVIKDKETELNELNVLWSENDDEIKELEKENEVIENKIKILREELKKMK